jgi:uncharacterized Zn finger protein (UPF0148 family)
MSLHCEDCGTRLSGTACPNCEEEFVIYRDQRDDMTEAPSREFLELVCEQAQRVKARTKRRLSTWSGGVDG